MTKILVYDPGESTGWCFRDQEGKLHGGTLPKDHLEVAQHIRKLQPDIVVLERFNLYPGKARSLAWNSFYPCETIGVIKVVCAELRVPYVEQAPSVKKYFGGFQADWQEIVSAPDFKRTEHVKDAYQHYRYFLLNAGKQYSTK